MIAGCGKHFLEIRNTGKNGGHRFKTQAHSISEQAGYGRLASARRSPEDDGAYAPSRNPAADRPLRSGQMLLPHDFGQASGPQPVGPRGALPRFGGLALRPEERTLGR